MKVTIASLIFTLGFSCQAFAQDRTDIDTLPDITELPTLDLSAPAESDVKAIDITADLNAAKTEDSSSRPILDDIPAAQKELIERLNYKKPEGSKMKRYKPEFGITASNIQIGASQKE
jgi:hypothetical protein